MPELPEVETVRRGLASRVSGRTIQRVEVGRERVVRRTSADSLIYGLTGARIESVDRRGKYLLLPLDTGDAAMIHLRMSGRVLLAQRGATRPAHTHVVMELDDGNDVWFVDPRTFGEVVVYDPDRIHEQLPDVARLGPDPVRDDLSPAVFRAIVRSSRRALKPLLLDQHVVAGIGNIYADEILHAARLRPDRRADSLDARATRRLHGAMHRVLRAAIDAGGSTLADAQYVDLMGASGSYQDDHRVYGRAGERCTSCGRGWVRRTVSAGRGTHWCPVCQR